MMPDNTRLKVLFLPASYPSDVNPVAGIFIREHARAVSRYNDVVVLYAHPDPAPQRRHSPTVSEVSEDGIRTIRVRYGGIIFYWWRRITSGGQQPVTSSGTNGRIAGWQRLLAVPRVIVADLVYYRRILSSFRRLVGEGWRPDIIHAHVYSAAVPAVMLGRLYRIPVVVSEHSSAFPRHLLNATERFRARFAMNRARIILPVSGNLGGHIQTYGIKNQFKVVPNAVDTSLFCPAHQGSEQATDRQKRLLFVGSLIPVKGIPYLLEALSRLGRSRQDFVLDMVGDGAQRSEYEELASRLGLTGIVRFHGLKSKDEVARFMGDCDFYVQPSLWENLPCVLIEATACGKPVIATDVGGVQEIVNTENGLLVPPEDATALQEAVEYLLDNCQHYSAERIARHARERFSYEAVGRMLDELYRELVKT